MSNAIFPALPGLTWNITRTPKFSTKVQQAVGGSSIAAAFQPYPIWQWQLEYEFLRTYSPFSEWQTLAGFFNARLGGWDTFLYQDPEDANVAGQLIGIGNGTTRTFQIGRSLAGGLFEPLYNFDLVTAPLQFFLNGLLQSGTYSFANNTTGIVTFNTAPPAGVAITWTGYYYWRCRFAQDTTQFGMFAQHFWLAQAVSFFSVLGA